jgi:hypothetical protein
VSRESAHRAVRLSALCTGRALLCRNISFLLEAEYTPGPNVAGQVT